MIVQTLVRSTVMAVGMCGFLGIPSGPGQARATEAGQTIARLQSEGPDVLASLQPVLLPISLPQTVLNEILVLLKLSFETNSK